MMFCGVASLKTYEILPEDTQLRRARASWWPVDDQSKYAVTHVPAASGPVTTDMVTVCGRMFHLTAERADVVEDVLTEADQYTSPVVACADAAGQASAPTVTRATARARRTVVMNTERSAPR